MSVLLQVAGDTNPILVGLVLAFVTQAVASWLANASLKTKVSGLCDDMKEMHNLHPRQGNPGEKRIHDTNQFCPNPECLLKREGHE